MLPGYSMLSPVSADRSAPGTGARRPSALPQPWHPDPPSYEDAIGTTWSSAPAARSAPRHALEQVDNIVPLWSRASERALAKPLARSGELPRVVQKELLTYLKQRQRTEKRCQRTEMKLVNARDCLQQVEREGRSNAPLQTLAARGGLFDDDDYSAYAREVAHGAVHHYETKREHYEIKRELLLSAHAQRMAQLARRMG